MFNHTHNAHNTAAHFNIEDPPVQPTTPSEYMKYRKHATPHNDTTPTTSTTHPKRRIIRRCCCGCFRSAYVKWGAAVCFLTLTAWAMYVLYYVVLIQKYGPPYAPEQLTLRNFEIPIKDLPESLVGLKLAQLSDLHFNDNNSHEMGTSDTLMEQAVEAINKENVDIIFLTGDYVDHWPETVGVLAKKYLSRLKSKYGIYASMGNHDHERPQTQALVFNAFQEAGINLLVNTAAFPIPNNKLFEVIGIGDILHWNQYQPHRALGHLPKATQNPTERKKGEPVRVILSHNPDTVKDIRVYQSDLILAGHTHGGRGCFPVPFNWLIPIMARLPPWIRKFIPNESHLDVVRNWDWDYGFHVIRPDSSTPTTTLADATTELADSTTILYTSSGLARMPPRYLCQPEVVVFTLVKRN